MPYLAICRRCGYFIFNYTKEALITNLKNHFLNSHKYIPDELVNILEPKITLTYKGKGYKKRVSYGMKTSHKVANTYNDEFSIQVISNEEMMAYEALQVTKETKHWFWDTARNPPAL